VCVAYSSIYIHIFIYSHHSYQRARSKCGCSEISFFLKFAPIKTHFCKTKPFNLNRLEQIGRNKTEWASSTRWCLGNGHASGDTPQLSHWSGALVACNSHRYRRYRSWRGHSHRRLQVSGRPRAVWNLRRREHSTVQHLN